MSIAQWTIQAAPGTVHRYLLDSDRTIMLPGTYSSVGPIRRHQGCLPAILLHSSYVFHSVPRMYINQSIRSWLTTTGERSQGLLRANMPSSKDRSCTKTPAGGHPVVFVVYIWHVRSRTITPVGCHVGTLPIPTASLSPVRRCPSAVSYASLLTF